MKQKQASFYSALVDYEDCFHHMCFFKSVSGRQIVDWDETSCSREKFRKTIGRAVDKVVVHEWKLGGFMWCAIGVYSDIGWLKWRIYKTSIDSEIIKSFIENELAEVLGPDQFAIFDGASIHLTDDVLSSINRVTGGRYKKVPAYAHWLSPVERGFSNVWRYIRNNMVSAERDPESALNEAFKYYSFFGPGGQAAKHHFDMYERSYQMGQA